MLERFVFELWKIMLELSPALLLGLLLAGLIHAFLPTGFIKKRLSKNSIGSVFQAVIAGIPMPLCSCGVVPTTIGLHNDGASKGAATGFLISTPQTGVDSILVSASFLGWPFALFKVVAAFVTGMIGGALVNVTNPQKQPAPEVQSFPVISGQEIKGNRLIQSIRYMIFDLMAAIDLWLVIGIFAAALITLLIPPGFFTGMEWTQGIGGMIVVLFIALPMYVCTTSSVPIAASLIAAGMPVGSALVFLMAGPATNLATMGAVYRSLGGRVLGIYLGTVTVLSLLFGLVFDFILPEGAQVKQMHHAHGGGILEMASAVIVIALLSYLLFERLRKRIFSTQHSLGGANNMDVIIKVEGMSCQHCVANVKKTLESQPGVQEATPDLSSKTVGIKGESFNLADLERSIIAAGYQVKK